MKNNAFQSADYVPGVSGYRLDLETGALEINSGHVAAGSLPSAPQLITVTAGEWSESDLPSNAVERYKFIGDAVMKIPAEHRDSAEFSTEDISFDRDGSDIRTTLTYRRLETDQEAAGRVVRPARSTVNLKGGDVTVMYDGKVFVRLGRQMDDEQPFVVQGGQVFINQASINRASIDSAMSSVKVQLNAQGQYVATGIGLGIDPGKGEKEDGQTEMERAIEKGDASEILRLLTSQIADSDLGLVLRSKIYDQAEAVRHVIRDELKPGGMLHRG